jgi:SAM-dependent methyltransferase
MHSDQYLSQLGMLRFADAKRFWDFLNAAEHQVLRQSLVRMVSARAKGEFSAADGDVLTASPSVVKIVHDAFAAHIQSLLRIWNDLRIPSGAVLDLGCGAGVATCFYALSRPNVEVVGVDESPVAIDTARQIALELGLKNVSFVCSDIATTHLNRTFSLVCSSSVWAEMESGQSRSTSYFSAIDEISGALHNSQSELAACAARHLEKGGAYLSFERCHDVASLAQWVGAQKAAGLWVDLATSSMVQVNGIMTGTEVMPVLIATAEPTLLTDNTLLNEESLVSWRQRGANPSAELAVECRIHRGTNWKVVQGYEVTIADAHGEATAQLYLLQSAHEAVVYFRTNRGAREILGESSSGAEELQRLFVEVLNDLLANVQVVNSQPVTMIQ